MVGWKECGGSMWWGRGGPGRQEASVGVGREGGMRCGCLVPQFGQQPLHLASDRGHCDVASVLIEKGAPLDVADQAGSTPAHLAAERGHEGVLRVLGETEQGGNSFEMKNNKVQS